MFEEPLLEIIKRLKKSGLKEKDALMLLAAYLEEMQESILYEDIYDHNDMMRENY